MRRAITLMGLGLVAGIVFLTSRHRVQAPGVEVSWIPAEVDLVPEHAEETGVGLGGTLVGGRLFYGRTAEEGRRAAQVDIARGRPQWIGYGSISYHHSGVNTRLGLPGVDGNHRAGWGGMAFMDAYNAEVERALEVGTITPPEQVNPASHLFAYLGRFARGETWPELGEGETALRRQGARLVLSRHPESPRHGVVVLQRGPGATRISFAFVTLPVQWHEEVESGEIVLREEGTIRVFHGGTGQLLREFPFHERDIQEIRDILARREAQEAEDR